MSSAVRMRLPGILNGLLALWLILSSFLLGFGDVRSKASDIIIGFFIIFLSMHRGIPSDESRWMSLFSGMLGLGAIAAPFVFSYSDVSSALTNNIIVGGLIFLISIWGFLTVRTPEPQHG